MKGDLTRRVFLAFLTGDRDEFLEVADEIVRAEEEMRHHVLAQELRQILQTALAAQPLREGQLARRYKDAVPIPRDAEKGFPLLEIQEWYLDWDDVVLGDEVARGLEQIIEENKKADALSNYGLMPKQRVLFCGPPGTGKTLSAQLMSSKLAYPLVLVRFDSIVSSFLGETASNLRRIFDFIEHGRWVVLFDEFDVIGKHRDDPHEHGEIKRVVNNFMQMLDHYRGDSLLVAATNHQYLLDPGLWRRFDEVLFFDLPDMARRRRVFLRYLRVMEKDGGLDLDSIARETEGFSAADIAQVCWEAVKRSVLQERSAVGEEELQWAVRQQQRRKAVEGRSNG